MKVSYIVPSIDKSAGGPPRSVDDILNALAKQATKFSFHLHTGLSDNPVTGSVNERFVITFYSKSIFGKFRELNRILKNDNTELLHIQTIWSLSLHQAAVLAKKNGIPYLISPRGMLEPWSLSQKKWKKQMALWLYQRNDLKNADCIHATCLMEAENIRNLGFKKPIAIIPNGIKLKNFPFKSTSNSGIKKLLFLSRIHPKKGIELLINAWSNLSNEVTSGWKVEIVGNGDNRYIASLNRLISNKGLKSDIIIKPPVYGKAKANLYQEADLFILPTYSENFGIVIAEALASGTPVITTRGTPWNDLIESQCGWWVEANESEIANAIGDALSKSPNELLQMGQNGRKLVEAKYSIEVVAKQMRELYLWLVEKKNKPSFLF